MPFIQDRSIGAISALAGMGQASRRLKENAQLDQQHELAVQTAKERLAAMQDERARADEQDAYARSRRGSQEKLTQQQIRMNELQLRDAGEGGDPTAPIVDQRGREYDTAVEELTRGLDPEDAQRFRLKAAARRQLVSEVGKDIPNPKLRATIQDREFSRRMQENQSDVDHLQSERLLSDLGKFRDSGYLDKHDDRGRLLLDELEQRVKEGKLTTSQARNAFDNVRENAVEFTVDQRSREDLAQRVEEEAGHWNGREATRYRRQAINLSERLRAGTIKLQDADREFQRMDDEANGRGALGGDSGSDDPRLSVMKLVLQHAGPFDTEEDLNRKFNWGLSVLSGGMQGPDPAGVGQGGGTTQVPGGEPGLSGAADARAQVAQRPTASPEEWNNFVKQLTGLDGQARVQAILQWQYNPFVRPDGAKGRALSGGGPSVLDSNEPVMKDRNKRLERVGTNF